MTAPDWWRLSYRGYGGSDGKPTEDGLIADARAAYDFARATYPDAKIVLWGESLGTGVAVALAAEKDVAAVILEAPFTSTADVAFSAYPFVPVRLLMKDQFRSDERIGKVTAPVLVMHGARDRIVPFRLGEQLFAPPPTSRSNSCASPMAATRISTATIISPPRAPSSRSICVRLLLRAPRRERPRQHQQRKAQPRHRGDDDRALRPRPERIDEGRHLQRRRRIAEIGVVGAEPGIHRRPSPAHSRR